jgi:hypothetical protein
MILNVLALLAWLDSRRIHNRRIVSAVWFSGELFVELIIPSAPIV